MSRRKMNLRSAIRQRLAQGPVDRDTLALELHLEYRHAKLDDIDRVIKEEQEDMKSTAGQPTTRTSGHSHPTSHKDLETISPHGPELIDTGRAVPEIYKGEKITVEIVFRRQYQVCNAEVQESITKRILPLPRVIGGRYTLVIEEAGPDDNEPNGRTYYKSGLDIILSFQIRDANFAAKLLENKTGFWVCWRPT